MPSGDELDRDTEPREAVPGPVTAAACWVSSAWRRSTTASREASSRRRPASQMFVLRHVGAEPSRELVLSSRDQLCVGCVPAVTGAREVGRVGGVGAAGQAGVAFVAGLRGWQQAQAGGEDAVGAVVELGKVEQVARRTG